MTKPKALIFDWDDTIVATFKAVLDLHHQFLRTKGSKKNIENKLKQLWGNPLTKVLAGLHPESEIKELEKEYYNFLDQADFVVKPFDFTQDTLVTLKRQDYLMGVVSSSPRIGLEKTVRRHMSLPMDTFLAIHTGDDDDFHKPDPRVFNKIFNKMSELGISEKDAVYIGDSLRDFQAAKERGIEFVAVLTGFTTRDDFLKAEIRQERILKSLQDLPKLLEDQY